MKRVCVFLGSNVGTNESYVTATRKLGAVLAKNNITLVYGGTNQGLMGELANAVLAHGGHVIGVIPECLINKKHAHEHLSEIIPTQSMNDRKTLLKNLADGFIVLPGGVGTLDELFEVITENKVGLHNKPIGILNVQHFYDPLLQFLNQMVTANFFNQKLVDTLVIATEPQQLLNKLLQMQPNKSKIAIHDQPTLTYLNLAKNNFLDHTMEATLSYRIKFLLNCCTFASLAVPFC